MKGVKVALFLRMCGDLHAPAEICAIECNMPDAHPSGFTFQECCRIKLSRAEPLLSQYSMRHQLPSTVNVSHALFSRTLACFLVL